MKEVDALTNKQFIPSKIAQSGLNYFNKDEESSLVKKECYPEEILNIFRMIFIMLNENYEHVEPSKYFEYLITDLFPKYNIDSMSKISIIKKIFSLFILQIITKSHPNKLLPCRSLMKKTLNC